MNHVKLIIVASVLLAFSAVAQAPIATTGDAVIECLGDKPVRVTGLLMVPRPGPMTVVVTIPPDACPAPAAQPAQPPAPPPAESRPAKKVI